jgi:hypothetical protein
VSERDGEDENFSAGNRNLDFRRSQRFCWLNYPALLAMLFLYARFRKAAEAK